MVYSEIMAVCQYLKLKHSTRLFLIIKTIFHFIIAKYFDPKKARQMRKYKNIKYRS